MLAQQNDASADISIHALREEGDSLYQMGKLQAQYFYPRPPRGGRLGSLRLKQMTQKISIHALREEGD